MTQNSIDNSFIIKDKLYPIVESVLSTSVGDRKFKQLVGNFLDRNNEKLHTSGPVCMIPFGDTDKANFLSIFNITQETIKKMVDEIIKKIGSSSDFKLLKGNPCFWLFYCCIRFYTLKNDQKGVNTALAIYALAAYPSIFHKYFSYGADEAVMQYTMDHLTDKYLMKQKGHVFGALFASINNSYSFLKPDMKDCSDKAIIKFIQRIHNDQNSMIKKICDQYMQNHAKGLRVTLTKDSFDEVQIDDEKQNKSSIVEIVSRKIVLQIINNGVDLKRAGYTAKIAGVSISDTRFYMGRIIVDKYMDKIEKFIESVLFIYLYDNNKTREDINSSQFLKFSEELFRKTNSNDPNIKNIKKTLDDFAEDIGVHEKYKRLATRVCYKRAIYMYIILSIMAYNK